MHILKKYKMRVINIFQVPNRLRVTASDVGAQMSGYLHRGKCTSGSSALAGGGGSGNSISTLASATKFKRMWFVLKDRVLYSYRAPEDTVAVDTCPVLGFDLEVESQVTRNWKK